MIACSKYSHTWFWIPLFLACCVCALVSNDFNADPLWAFRHPVCTAWLSGCEPQRMRLLTLKFLQVCWQLRLVAFYVAGLVHCLKCFPPLALDGSLTFGVTRIPIGKRLVDALWLNVLKTTKGRKLRRPVEGFSDDVRFCKLLEWRAILIIGPFLIAVNPEPCLLTFPFLFQYKQTWATKLARVKQKIILLFFHWHAV